MTVSSVISKIVYTADGATTAWSFSFALTGPGDIQVFVTNAIGNVTQVPSNAFSVVVNAPIDPNPTSIGGIVNYPLTGPPLAVGNTLTIARIMVENQPVSISNQSIIYPPVVEQSFDRLMMVDQQLSDEIDRALKVGIGDLPMLPLPSPSQRANQQAVFDSAGNLTAGGAVVGTIISPPMVPVVTAPTLTQARSAMGVPGFDSPVFTGNPQVPTAPLNDNDTTAASTQFVQNQLAVVGFSVPTGTRLAFQQTTAPIGWVKDTTHDDKALRIVNGTVGTGGTLAFSAVFSRTATDPHIITINEMPSHNHGVSDPGHIHSVVNAEGLSTFMCVTAGPASFIAAGADIPYTNISARTLANTTSISIGNAGLGQSHTHGIDTRVLYVDFIIAQKS